jgi:hypothetical protein
MNSVTFLPAIDVFIGIAGGTFVKASTMARIVNLLPPTQPSERKSRDYT